MNLLKPFSMAGGHSSPPRTPSSRHHPQQHSGVERSSASTPGSLTPPPPPLHHHKMLTTLQMGGENSAFTPTRGNLNPSVDMINGGATYPTSSASPTSSVSEINVHEESVASGDDDDERLDVVGGIDLSPTAVPIKSSDPEEAPIPPQLSLSAAERVAAWRHAELASRILLQHPRRE